MTSTTKKFKLHPKFIVNAIEQQANGLPKAIVELIMNSIDANATQINIKLWLNAYSCINIPPIPIPTIPAIPVRAIPLELN
ncbi:hypothetical protein JH858_003327 [Acinetobacter baumannii]